MKHTERQRELWRSVLLKIYPKLDQWPIEDKEDWITLHIREIHQLFLIAKREGYLEAVKELNSPLRRVRDWRKSLK